MCHIMIIALRWGCMVMSKKPETKKEGPKKHDHHHEHADPVAQMSMEEFHAQVQPSILPEHYDKELKKLQLRSLKTVVVSLLLLPILFKPLRIVNSICSN